MPDDTDSRLRAGGLLCRKILITLFNLLDRNIKATYILLTLGAWELVESYSNAADRTLLHRCANGQHMLAWVPIVIVPDMPGPTEEAEAKWDIVVNATNIEERDLRSSRPEI